LKKGLGDFEESLGLFRLRIIFILPLTERSRLPTEAIAQTGSEHAKGRTPFDFAQGQ
jgi:hypothetical protein